jgi:hypothetical protein
MTDDFAVHNRMAIDHVRQVDGDKKSLRLILIGSFLESLMTLTVLQRLFPIRPDFADLIQPLQHPLD